MVDIKENKAMRMHLTMMSLSPIFFLMGIRYYDVELIGSFWRGVYDTPDEIWHIVIILFSAIWVVVSLVFLLIFKRSDKYGWEEGYTMKNVSVEKESSLNFFVTFIIPMIYDDLDCWQNCFSFGLIITLLVVLLFKTDLFYANPILTILGYEIIRFEFAVSPYPKLDGEIIGICVKHCDPGKVIKFKFIKDNIICAKPGGN